MKRTPKSAADTPAPSAAAIEACWSNIGVYGNRRCPDLAQFVHCRNCPVHSSAGARLLNRTMPGDYRLERTAHYAAAKQLRDGRAHSALIFRLGTAWLAMPTQVFQEVAERRPIHSLPHCRHGLVLGLASVRGELLLTVSLGDLLGLAPRTSSDPRTFSRNPGRNPSRDLPEMTARMTTKIAEWATSEVGAGRAASARGRLLVAHWYGQRWAFPVDEVCGPHRFDPEQLQTPPATLAKAQPAFTRSVLPWQQHAVGLLDAELVFAALNWRML